MRMWTQSLTSHLLRRFVSSLCLPGEAQPRGKAMDEGGAGPSETSKELVTEQSLRKTMCEHWRVHPKDIVCILSNFTFIVKGQTLCEGCWVPLSQCHQNCYTQQGPLLINPLCSDTAAHGRDDWNAALLKERAHRSCNSPLTFKLGFPRFIMKLILHLLLIYFKETRGTRYYLWIVP